MTHLLYVLCLIFILFFSEHKHTFCAAKFSGLHCETDSVICHLTSTITAEQLIQYCVQC